MVRLNKRIAKVRLFSTRLSEYATILIFSVCKSSLVQELS